MRRVLGQLLAMATALIAVVAFTTTPVSAQPQTPTRVAAAPAPFDQIPMTGTGPNGETFTGTFQPTGFAADGDQVVLNGLLNGTVTDASGASAGEVSNSAAALPVLFPPAECPILNLVLGPLDLDLLGLQIHLDRVVLDLTAVSGPGNLLGNLLCAITNLLNGGGGLSRLAALIAQLNQLLGLGG